MDPKPQYLVPGQYLVPDLNTWCQICAICNKNMRLVPDLQLRLVPDLQLRLVPDLCNIQ